MINSYELLNAHTSDLTPKTQMAASKAVEQALFFCSSGDYDRALEILESAALNDEAVIIMRDMLAGADEVSLACELRLIDDAEHPTSPYVRVRYSLQDALYRNDGVALSETVDYLRACKIARESDIPDRNLYSMSADQQERCAIEAALQANIAWGKATAKDIYLNTTPSISDYAERQINVLLSLQNSLIGQRSDRSRLSLKSALLRVRAKELCGERGLRHLYSLDNITSSMSNRHDEAAETGKKVMKMSALIGSGIVKQYYRQTREQALGQHYPTRVFPDFAKAEHSSLELLEGPAVDAYLDYMIKYHVNPFGDYLKITQMPKTSLGDALRLAFKHGRVDAIRRLVVIFRSNSLQSKLANSPKEFDRNKGMDMKHKAAAAKYYESAGQFTISSIQDGQCAFETLLGDSDNKAFIEQEDGPVAFKIEKRMALCRLIADDSYASPADKVNLKLAIDEVKLELKRIIDPVLYNQLSILLQELEQSIYESTATAELMIAKQ